MGASNNPRGRFLRIRDVAANVALSEPTINRMHRLGEFPPKVRLHGRLTGWWESEIEAWKAARDRVATHV